MRKLSVLAAALALLLCACGSPAAPGGTTTAFDLADLAGGPVAFDLTDLALFLKPPQRAALENALRAELAGRGYPAGGVALQFEDPDPGSVKIPFTNSGGNLERLDTDALAAYIAGEIAVRVAVEAAVTVGATTGATTGTQKQTTTTATAAPVPATTAGTTKAVTTPPSLPFDGALVFDFETSEDYHVVNQNPYSEVVYHSQNNKLGHVGSAQYWGKTDGRVLPVFACRLGGQKFYFQPSPYDGKMMELNVYTMGADGKPKKYDTLYDRTKSPYELIITIIPSDANIKSDWGDSIEYEIGCRFYMSVRADYRYIASYGESQTFQAQYADGFYMYDTKTGKFTKM
ncbi:MAG: hypothetical protein LBB75_03110 [Oscillospiraceae bacterium]|jgi:hypothetical protein|nr:hypothetical protein [Oscillospiraceae bacterium]